jgi:hypothetical protein
VDALKAMPVVEDKVGHIFGRDGRGCLAGRRGGGRQNSINGVDTSDPTRSFTSQEWKALYENGGHAYVMQAWNNIHNSGREHGRDNTRGGGAGRQPHMIDLINADYQMRIAQEALTDALPAVGRGDPRRGGGGGDRGGMNGRGFGRGAYQEGGRG